MGDIPDDAVAHKLLASFIQFDKIEWHQRSFMGYKPSEIKLLFCVKKCTATGLPEMKVSEISKILRVTSPTVTQLVKSLEANGLIERNIDPSDRRAVGIKLTAKGDMVTNKAGQAFSATMHGLAEYLGPEQSNQFAELLSKVFEYFNQHHGNLTPAYGSGDTKE